jgi:N6-adenosine-specific RNA methylase IME4
MIESGDTILTESSWPFGALQPKAYQLLLIDPPTAFETHSDKGQGKSASQHYAVLSIDDLCQWPIGDLADPSGCLVVLWSTWALAAQGEHTRMLKAWGLIPSSGGSWAKITRNGLPSFGTGYVLRDACEPYFTARGGKRLPAGLRHTERNLILAERREHSRKPDEMHEMLERLAPTARKAELFARATRPGWESFGNEVDKFDRMAAE